MIEFSVAPYDPGLAGPIARLFAQEGFQRSPEYLAWIFNAPGGTGMVATARDMARNGEIVGVLGLVPAQVHCAGAALDSHLAIDLVVDPDYRGRGVFMGLGRAALDWSEASGAQLVWGFPNQSAAHAWFNRFSWVNLGLVPLLARPLRTGALLGRLMPSLARLDVPLVRRNVPEPPGFRKVTEFGSETDQLWDRFAARAGCCSVRDARSLSWRLLERPGRGYRTVASFGPSGTMHALVCSTMEPRHGGTILFILEAMSDSDQSDGHLLGLLRHELSFAARRGADAALCWSPTSAPNRRAYRRAAFLPVPERLRPAKSFVGVKPAPAFAQDLPRDWYVSFLDLDVI